MTSADTSAEARATQLELRRALSPGERLRRGLVRSAEATELFAAGVRARHPDYTADDVRWAVCRHRVGDELFRQAWPGAPILDP